MDNPEVMAKRKERIQTIIVLSPFVFLLIWNAVFFYTDWWETYLKPTGLHTWLDSLHWLRPIYDGLETRIYQHDADAQKYMVLISWGLAWIFLLGISLLTITYRTVCEAIILEFRKQRFKGRLKLFLSMLFIAITSVIAPYSYLTEDYGSFANFYLARGVYAPSFNSLIFLQLTCFAPFIAAPIAISALNSFILVVWKDRVRQS